jgi:hypothetical protein
MIVCGEVVCDMPDEIKAPLLAAGNELIVAAFKAFRAGSLGSHDLRTINQCVGRANTWPSASR